MIIPSIHKNGTSKAYLLNHLQEAHAAMHNAIIAVQKTCPHDRDYYPQGEQVGILARRDHYIRIEKLHSVQRELLAIAIGIVEGGAKHPGVK